MTGLIVLGTLLNLSLLVWAIGAFETGDSGDGDADPKTETPIVQKPDDYFGTGALTLGSDATGGSTVELDGIVVAVLPRGLSDLGAVSVLVG